jgi:polyisoprenoid-binding protein YceI
MSVKQWIVSLIVVGASVSSVAAVAASYTVDPNHTYPSFEMSHMGMSIWRGKFDRTSGAGAFDLAAKTGHVEIQVDSSSINFGLDKMNEEAVGEDFLNVKKFPTMTYKGEIKFKGGKPVAVDGQLTLLGVTKPVNLKINSYKCMVSPFLKKDVCGADAEGEFNRNDFGMTKYGEGEAGKMHLRIQVEAVKNS